ncbi:hypothetical protein AUH73_03755 [archaeon 13_1_40CM_4_53_4]|nr:MAG: hypothetical protein AUI07_01320 [archaeon 13_2_20CM_2_53_6]OLC62787.1 MAG: hypothetical protein AUH73_03755 [archaeon 13_1_40CM_4_53_4]OLE58816.1 MAG: hypothetical protein AUG17_05345 [Crenarchaeota archaeon 13_1_20CM_2_53_14]TMI26618.1 MAG: hypothetical protein E6H24_02470 [Candidatus Bathyarchaeota archaeon]
MNIKFMQTVERDVYRKLRDIAKERGVTVQELLRAVILPDWMANYNGKQRKSRMARAERRLVTAS